MTNEIHPLIQATGYSDQWKLETNGLLLRHPFSERILTLANNPNLCRREGRDGRPNCFGTALWVLDIDKGSFPEFFPRDGMPYFLGKYFEKVNEPPQLPTKGMIFTMGIGDGYYTHAGVYLGKSCNTPVLFEQPDTGLDYRFLGVNGHSMVGSGKFHELKGGSQ